MYPPTYFIYNFVSNMCEEITILDKINLHYKTQATFACHSSNDRRISLICDAGIYVLELYGNTENWKPIFSFSKTFCTLLRYSISTFVEIDINSFIEELTQFKVYETVLNVCLSENLKQCTSTPTQPISAVWSPNKLNHYIGCVLAVLTNTGVVQVFSKSINCYGREEYNVLNITECIINHFKPNWKQTARPSADQKLAQLKYRISQIAATGRYFLNLYRCHIFALNCL